MVMSGYAPGAAPGAAHDADPVLLAAGGTGGHVFPAGALAAELILRGYRPVLVTDRRGGGAASFPDGVPAHVIDAAGLVGRGLTARLGAVLRLARGYIQSRALLRRIEAPVVIGFGGYASVPVLLAAAHLGRRTMLHEQNAVLGRANRLLARRADVVATAFPVLENVTPELSSRAVHIGNPVRPDISAAGDASYRPPSGESPLHLLVFGGSQGASVFAEILPAALALLPEALRARLSVAQQSRIEDVEALRQAYDRAGITAEVAPFFDDMTRRYAGATLVVCRSGASTMAELAAVGRPAILVPFPHAADDHQAANARHYAAAGACWTMPQESFTPPALANRLEGLFAGSGEALAQAALRARAEARPDAAAHLADLVERTIEARGRRSIDNLSTNRPSTEKSQAGDLPSLREVTP